MYIHRSVSHIHTHTPKTSFTDAQTGQTLEAAYTTALGRCIDLVTVLLLPEEALILASPNRVASIEETMGKYIFPLDRVRVARKPTAGVFALLGAGVTGASVLGEELPAGQCKVLQGGRMVAWTGTGLGLPGLMVAAFEEEGPKALVAAAAGKGMRVGGMAEWEVRVWVCGIFWGWCGGSRSRCYVCMYTDVPPLPTPSSVYE